LATPNYSYEKRQKELAKKKKKEEKLKHKAERKVTDEPDSTDSVHANPEQASGTETPPN